VNKKRPAHSNGSQVRRTARATVVALAKKYLEPHQSKDFRIDVLDEAERQSDGWWYVYFRPNRDGLKSYESRVVEAMMDLMDKESKCGVAREFSRTHFLSVMETNADDAISALVASVRRPRNCSDLLCGVCSKGRGI
jgi:hypothetical protein